PGERLQPDEVVTVEHVFDVLEELSEHQ
ncbi:competence regulator inhibitor paratox, partial [Streptococcus ferus]